MATDPVNYYEILGIRKDATSEEIRKAYRKLSRNAHPDTGGNDGLFRFVTSAYETLSDPTLRAAYDVTIGGEKPYQRPPLFYPTNPEPTAPEAPPTQSTDPKRTPNGTPLVDFVVDDDRTHYWPDGKPLGEKFDLYYKNYLITHHMARVTRNVWRAIVAGYWALNLGLLAVIDSTLNSLWVSIFSDAFIGFFLVLFGVLMWTVGGWIITAIFSSYGKRIHINIFNPGGHYNIDGYWVPDES